MRDGSSAASQWRDQHPAGRSDDAKKVKKGKKPDSDLDSMG